MLRLQLAAVLVCVGVAVVVLAQRPGAGTCPAPTCNQDVCNEFEDCKCSGNEVNITRDERPQLIFLTYDDAVTAYADDNFYTKLYDGHLLNPNGCPITATHFVSHQYNDYSLVHKYYALGHEIAVHSITHRSNTTYWRTLPLDGWKAEIADMRYMLNKYAKVPTDDIVGHRAPFLQGGGDTMYEMLLENGFEYDCSAPSREFGYTNMHNGRWAHTLDYLTDMDCQIEPCPRCSWPGLWNQPLLQLEDEWYDADGDLDYGEPCAMFDSCIIPTGTDPADTKNMMMKNFLRAYNGNTRAPIGFYVHTALFISAPWKFEGYMQFLEEVTATYDDVYIVPIKAGLEYLKNPPPLAEVGNFFGCDDLPVNSCTSQLNCRFQNVTTPDFDAYEIYMKGCTPCPPAYPWLGNPDGNAP